jgi:hypothetical protein
LQMAKSKARKKRKTHKPVRRAKRKKAVKRRTKPVARKRKKKAAPRKRKAVTGARKKTPAKRRKRSQGRKLVKQVEKRSVERVMAGKKPRRRRKRRVRMAGRVSRRRTVGKSGSSGLLIGLAIGAGALYLLTKGSGPTTPINYGSLPPLNQTGNYTRDTQSQQIVNYALAAGLAISAITSLINSLNTSSDNTVNNVYDKVNTTGTLSNLGLPGYDIYA